MDRPSAPHAPNGYRWHARVDPDWLVPDGGPRLLVSGQKARCRSPRCKAPAVATLDRGHCQHRYWHYCAAHLYGRWIEDGHVMEWVLRAEGEGLPWENHRLRRRAEGEGDR